MDLLSMAYSIIVGDGGMHSYIKVIEAISRLYESVVLIADGDENQDKASRIALLLCQYHSYRAP